MSLLSKSILIASVVAVEGCATVDYEGDRTFIVPSIGGQALDTPLFMPTESLADRWAQAASVNCNRLYSPNFDCNNVAVEMVQWIKKRFAKSPAEGCQTVAVRAVVIEGHAIIEIRTTNGKRYYNINGEKYDKAPEMLGYIF